MTFRTSAYKNRLSEEYLKQRIDDKMNSLLFSPPTRDYYSPSKIVRSQNLFSPSSIKGRQTQNMSLRESYSNSRIPLQTSTLSPRRLSPSYSSPQRDWKRNAAQYKFDEERRQREQRKREILRKIEELNEKFNSQNSEILSISRSYLPNRVAPVSPSYSSASQNQRIESQISRENTAVENENKNTQHKVDNQRNLKSQGSYTSQVSASESKLKQEIQNLEDTNNSLKKQVENLESQHEGISQNLKEQLNKIQLENARLQKQLKQQAEEGKATREADKKRDQDKLKEVEKQESESVAALKQTYEKKLSVASNLLQEALNRAEECQELRNEEQILLAIQKNPELLDMLSQKLSSDKSSSNGTTDEKLLEKISQMEKLLKKKDEMIRETAKNSELKSLEIQKMEELIDKFKALFQHMNEEKEILTAENDRLSEELDTLKTYFGKLLGQIPNEEGDQYEEYNGQEGAEHGQVEELEEEDEENTNGGENQIHENGVQNRYAEQNGDQYEDQDGEQEYNEDAQEREVEEVDQDGGN